MARRGGGGVTIDQIRRALGALAACMTVSRRRVRTPIGTLSY